MLKMIIRMNDEKITAENKYHLNGIYNTLNDTFQTAGLPRIDDGSGALVFRLPTARNRIEESKQDVYMSCFFYNLSKE